MGYLSAAHTSISDTLFLFMTMTIQLLLAALVIALAIYRRSLTGWIFAAMILGAIVGHQWPHTAVNFQILATIFLRLIKVIIAPLLFGTLVTGIAGHADLKKVGRVGVKALIIFEVVSTLALVVGFVAINITRAGYGIIMPAAAGAEPVTFATHSWSELLVAMFPENIAKSIAEGQTLQVVIFCMLFGVALAMVTEVHRRPLVQLASSLAETMFKFTNIIMYAAPVGVFGAMAYTVGHLGAGVFWPLLKLLLTMYLALAAFILLILVPLALLARIPLLRFMRALAEPLAIAFGTASSEAALPLSMERVESLGVSRETLSLVLPLGYSFNLAGSGLYESLALVFVAQASGIHLTLGQQALMLVTLLISSKGTAGVARGALVVVLAVAASFHLPMEVVLMLFGVDQLMDMGRTAINVLGNCLATVVVARWDGERGLFPASEDIATTR
jgi:proton glutamate symport protein